jgi:hypothetical protein
MSRDPAPNSDPQVFPVRPLEMDFVPPQIRPLEDPTPPTELSSSDLRFARIVSKTVALLVFALALASVAAALWFIRYLIHIAYHKP